MIKGHRKVHIVPVAFEIDRATLPVLDIGADKVYILTGEQEAHPPMSLAYAGLVEGRLGRVVRDIETVNYGTYDYRNIFSRLVDIGRKEKGNDVLINLSSGGHIVSIAGTLAASMFGWSIYYVEPERYNVDRKKPEGMTSGMKRVFEIKTYPIEKPEEKLVECLKLMDGIETQKSLMGKLERAGTFKDDLEGESFSKKSYMRFKREYLDPLIEKGWIKKDGSGKRGRLEITEDGGEIVRIFG